MTRSLPVFSTLRSAVLRAPLGLLALAAAPCVPGAAPGLLEAAPSTPRPLPFDRPALWAAHDAKLLAPMAPPKVDASAAHRFQGTRGHQVQAWDLGPREAPVVLWWTGGPGESVDPAHLAGRYTGTGLRMLVLEQPGTGRGGTPWVQDWRPEDSADDAATFLQLRGVKGPVIVAGWSWGSTMALLFAQRHPGLTRAVAVGGVWTNTPGEVDFYLGATGTRSLLPGLAEAFGPAGASACDLHRAIAQGTGGAAFAEGYGRAEGLQARLDTTLRTEVLAPLPRTPGRPVDMATETSPLRRFAFIESEMMCRGQRGQWQLELAFPQALKTVPLVVLQGRYDQVCDPQVAVKVWRAWPGTRKLLVPFNGGHGGAPSLPPERLAQAGVDPLQTPAVQKALRLHFGQGSALMAAALEGLARP